MPEDRAFPSALLFPVASRLLFGSAVLLVWELPEVHLGIPQTVFAVLSLSVVPRSAGPVESGTGGPSVGRKTRNRRIVRWVALHFASLFYFVCALRFVPASAVSAFSKCSPLLTAVRWRPGRSRPAVLLAASLVGATTASLTGSRSLEDGLTVCVVGLTMCALQGWSRLVLSSLGGSSPSRVLLMTYSASLLCLLELLAVGRPDAVLPPNAAHVLAASCVMQFLVLLFGRTSGGGKEMSPSWTILLEVADLVFILWAERHVLGVRVPRDAYYLGILLVVVCTSLDLALKRATVGRPPPGTVSGRAVCSYCSVSLR